MSSRCDLVLADVTLPDGRVADVSVRDGLVRHVGAMLPAEQVISCRGITVLPGAVDMHVHLRGGIQREKEDWESGSMSALAGGVTVVVDQPNTIPPLITPEAYRNRVAEAGRNSLCSFAINAGVAPGSDPAALWREGAIAFGEIFAAPSSYGEALSAEALSAALSGIGSLGALATIHAEEAGPGSPENLADHARNRPSRGETETVRTIFRTYGEDTRLHFCHVSVAGSVAAAGSASVEVTPHHLFLSIEQSFPDDTLRKVNPPLRSEKERQELWRMWDRIDVIASDHAPHTLREKNRSFGEAPSGIPGVETMLPILVARMKDGLFPRISLIEKTSWRPADILGIPRAGFQPGERADFALYGREVTAVSVDDLHSRAGWTPFEGFPAVFPDQVILAGSPAYRDGEFHETAPRWFSGRGYHP
ncbi:MAG: amidohydrolase family protein [Methanomicrobiales archaeon]|nr:amidohydrolase family protein [Methanomicrobiales archaeon]